MTLIVGIRCDEGIVMAADSAATFGDAGRATIGQQYVTKIHKLAGAMLYTSTGAVGISQVIADTIERAYSKKEFGGCKSPPDMMRQVGATIGEAVHPFIARAGMVGDGSTSLCKSLMAMCVDKKPCLFQFDAHGAPEYSTKELPFVALGSGQPIADPFLAYMKKLLWKDAEPTLAEGRLVATWAIDHATHTNPGGVGGPTRLAELTFKKGRPVVEICDSSRVDEHMEHIGTAEAALVRAIRPDESESAPTPPTMAKEDRAS